MARQIRLVRYEVPDINFMRLGAYRLRVAATDAVGVEPYVFLFLRGPVDPNTGTYRDVFHAVASPVDMEEYPPLAPDPTLPYPFFRLDSFELDLRSTEHVEATWDAVRTHVELLLEALDRFDTLQATQSVLLTGSGGTPPGHGSESSGSSESV